jgi:8-oxo-dGTP diphosphatase
VERKTIGIAVVEHEGRYLVGIRGPEGPLPGYAEFPGGKCDRDESPAGTAIRECFEETGLRVEIVEPLLEREFDYPHGRVDLRFFLCRPTTGSNVSDLRGTFRWAGATELARLTFPEANGPVIDKLIERAQRVAQSAIA